MNVCHQDSLNYILKSDDSDDFFFAIDVLIQRAAPAFLAFLNIWEIKLSELTGLQCHLLGHFLVVLFSHVTQLLGGRSGLEHDGHVGSACLELFDHPSKGRLTVDVQWDPDLNSLFNVELLHCLVVGIDANQGLGQQEGDDLVPVAILTDWDAAEAVLANVIKRLGCKDSLHS